MTSSGEILFNPLDAARQTLDTPLSRTLADRIRADEPISFRDWMDACLYHPQHGYYRRGRPTVGRDGDFLTSPEVHPLFGAAIGHIAHALWSQTQHPNTFHIAEVGPGTGAMAEALLRHLHANAPDCTESLAMTLVEADPCAAAHQRERLQSIHNFHTISAIAQLESRSCQLIIANELLDALPVHRLQFRDDEWQELRVGFSAARGFHDAPAPVSDLRLLAPLVDISPSRGQIVEVSPERADVVRAMASALADNGLLLLFDYGYRRSRLYAPWRRDGTLMTFSRHVPGDDPYQYPGEIDLTAHIDIDQAEQAALAAGLVTLPVQSQAEWLHQIGADLMPAVADATVGTADYLAARRAIEALTDPAGLGRINVLGYRRGESSPLPGWTAP